MTQALKDGEDSRRGTQGVQVVVIENCMWEEALPELGPQIKTEPMDLLTKLCFLFLLSFQANQSLKDPSFERSGIAQNFTKI